ncbi:MAG: hypothetical protein R2932_09825 [Caldilineaceae bacterium]
MKQSQQLTQDAAQFVEGMAQEVQVVPLVGYTDEVVLNYLGAKPIDLLVIGGFQDVENK